MNPIIGGALIGGVVGGGSAYGEYLASKKQNQWNLERRDDAWRREERLAGSVHQREVADLRKAGLNPILSAGGGGAPSPVGGMISSTDPGKGAQSGAHSALSNLRLAVELKKVKADTDLTTTQNKTASSNAVVAAANAWSALNVLKLKMKHPKKSAMADYVLPRAASAVPLIRSVNQPR